MQEGAMKAPIRIQPRNFKEKVSINNHSCATPSSFESMKTKPSSIHRFAFALLLAACGWLLTLSSQAGTLAIMKTSPLPAATAGIAYNQTITAEGGTAPLAWTITSGALPTGLVLNAANGLVSGTTIATGTANFTVKVTDAINASVTRDFALTVNDAPVIMTSSLPVGTVNVAYSLQMTVAGGTAQHTWSLATGSLPAGLTLNGTGLISGTPTAAGTFNLTLRVTDQNGAVANRSLTLTIQAQAEAPNLSAGQTLFSQRCAGCHTSSFIPFVGASKLILDTKGNHRNDSLLLDDSSKTNLALYLASRDNQTYNISGGVTNSLGQGLAGVTITATSGYQSSRNTTTAGNGTYALTSLAPGDYVISPALTGTTFNPNRHTIAVTRSWNLQDNVSYYAGLTAVNFIANRPPTVTLTEPMNYTAPMNNKAFVAPAKIELTASASDLDGSVAKVAFYADGQLLGNGQLQVIVTTLRFSFVWDNVPARTNSLITAVVTDNLGLNTTSAPVTIQVLTSVAAPGITLANGSAIYNLKCAACHGSPPGRNPTWPGIGAPDLGYVVGDNSHPGILASRSRYGDFNFVAYHIPGISNYFANVITESEKSDLSAYLASSVPERTSVAGTVRNSSGQPVAGATVNVSSLYNPSVSVATDSAGNYRVEGLLTGDYTVSATSDGLDPFYPVAYALNSDPGGSQGVYADGLRTIYIPHTYGTPPIPLDFAPGHRVQGSIRNANNRGLNGVLVWSTHFSSPVGSAVSDANGDFTLIAANGDYEVIIPQISAYPQITAYRLQGAYTFSPNSRSVTVAGADQSGVNFTITTAPILTISGKVTDPNGAGMSGVTVSLAEAPSVTATTAANGDYTLTSPDPGTFTVTPAKAIHLFTPANRIVTLGVGSPTNVNFTGATNAFTISGTVSTRSTSSGPPFYNTIPGEPISNVALSVSGGTVYTDAGGSYRLVLTNGTYTITPSRSNYLFNPPTLSVTVSGANRTGINLIGALQFAYVRTTGNNTNDGSSWALAKSSLQKAINVTANGGEVWVAGGIYYERISFGGISLYGIGKPVLDGKAPPFGGYNVTPGNIVMIDSYNYGGGTNGTRLDGFTIVNGQATSPNNGGGIFCQATDTEVGPVVIANNVISGNTARSKGGGIFLFGKATITNNVIIGNTSEFAGGIQCDYGSTLVTIANNLIAGNGGGGIGSFATSILIANNTIVDNTATNSGAGGIYFGAFSGNSTSANNIIAFNSSGIRQDYPMVTNRNNCVFGNLTTNYDGLTPGPGDVSVNPQFANQAGGDYRLLATSPLINAGNNSWVVGGADLAGEVRVAGATVDMGAYEYQTPNTAPTVGLTSPVNGASYRTPASFTMNAVATDADGTVTKVEYYAGDTLLGTVNSPPFAFSLNGLQVGTHQLTAAATDNRGARTVSTPIIVTVHPATDPTVAITSPLNGTRIAVPAQITIQANAADSDGSITNVEFFANGIKIGTDTSTPYSYVWTNVAAGTYTLTAKATDNSGTTTLSTPVNITAANPPRIQPLDTVYTGGEFRLPMLLEPGKSYLIQVSPDLVTWTTLQAFTAFGNAIDFVDTLAGNYPRRFYRIVQVE